MLQTWCVEWLGDKLFHQWIQYRSVSVSWKASLWYNGATFLKEYPRMNVTSNKLSLYRIYSNYQKWAKDHAIHDDKI